MSNESGRFRTIHKLDHYFFDVIGEEQAWLLGLMAADGNVNSKGSCSLGQSHDEGRVLLQAVAEMLKFDGKLYYTTKTDSYALSFVSRQICTQVSKYGIVPRKSTIYRFPELLKPERYAAFMRGWIDGDGCVGIYSHPTKNTITTSLLISFVGTKEFVQVANSILPVQGHINEKKQCANLAEYRITGKKAVELGEWIWQNAKLPEFYKLRTYRRFIQEHYQQRKYVFYARIRTQAMQLVNSGYSCSKAARELGIPFQSVCYWKNQENGNAII